MFKSQISQHKYDRAERTFPFAKRVRLFVKTLLHTITNIEDGKQLIRSSGSIGANYLKANEALGKKDFLRRIKIRRKEAKESQYWSRLIHETNRLQNSTEVERLIQEADELKMIFSSIVEKTKQ
jgi:four helix bundle protein